MGLPEIVHNDPIEDTKDRKPMNYTPFFVALAIVGVFAFLAFKKK